MKAKIIKVILKRRAREGQTFSCRRGRVDSYNNSYYDYSEEYTLHCSEYSKRVVGSYYSGSSYKGTNHSESYEVPVEEASEKIASSIIEEAFRNNCSVISILKSTCDLYIDHTYGDTIWDEYPDREYEIILPYEEEKEAIALSAVARRVRKGRLAQEKKGLKKIKKQLKKTTAKKNKIKLALKKQARFNQNLLTDFEKNTTASDLLAVEKKEIKLKKKLDFIKEKIKKI